MKTVLKILTFYILISSLSSCVEPLNIDVKSNSGSLVVDGMITDQPGPYTIKLSKSVDFFDASNSRGNSVTGAKVMITDNLGNEENLTESSAGTYRSSTTGIRGIVGREYTLHIQLENGDTYKSDSEELKPNIGLDTIISEFLIKTKFSDLNIELNRPGYDINVVSNELEGEDNFYRWRWTGTYEIRTFPELRTKTVEGVEVPNPLPCSGYIVVDGQLFDDPSTPCTCCECWVNEYTDMVAISENLFVKNGANFPFIHFIDIDGRRFYRKYHIKVEQLSLTKEAHDFWRLVKIQQEQGSLFDAPPGEVPSNIHNTENNDEVVLGYFSASSITSISKFLERSELPILVAPIDTLRGDCRTLENSSNQRPAFW